MCVCVWGGGGGGGDADILIIMRTRHIMRRNDNDVQIFGNSPPPSASQVPESSPITGLEWWNGIVECVHAKVTVGVLFLIEFQDPRSHSGQTFWTMYVVLWNSACAEDALKKALHTL